MIEGVYEFLRLFCCVGCSDVHDGGISDKEERMRRHVMVASSGHR
jgi:hypothetical protein